MCVSTHAPLLGLVECSFVDCASDGGVDHFGHQEATADVLGGGGGGGGGGDNDGDGGNGDDEGDGGGGGGGGDDQGSSGSGGHGRVLVRIDFVHKRLKTFSSPFQSYFHPHFIHIFIPISSMFPSSFRPCRPCRDRGTWRPWAERAGPCRLSGRC